MNTLAVLLTTALANSGTGQVSVEASKGKVSFVANPRQNTGCRDANDCAGLSVYCYRGYRGRPNFCTYGNGINSICRDNTGCGWLGRGTSSRKMFCEFPEFRRAEIDATKVKVELARPRPPSSGVCVDPWKGGRRPRGRRLEGTDGSDVEASVAEELEPLGDGTPVLEATRRQGSEWTTVAEFGQRCNYYTEETEESYTEPILWVICRSGLSCIHGRCRTCRNPPCEDNSNIPQRRAEDFNSEGTAVELVNPRSNTGCRDANDCGGLSVYCYRGYRGRPNYCSYGNGIKSICRDDTGCGWLGRGNRARKMWCQFPHRRADVEDVGETAELARPRPPSSGVCVDPWSI